MPPAPDTRASLLIRLKDRADDEAWSEFTEIYRPLICRLARRRGLQEADAEDLAQQVLASVARAIDRWEPDPARARFRTWLSRVATNAIVNALTRGSPDRGAGGAGLDGLLAAQPSPEESGEICLEQRREVFRWAARQVQHEFHPASWDAFWLTAVEGRAIESVAHQLGRSPGAVYALRSRIMRRLKLKVLEWHESLPRAESEESP